MRAFQFTVYQFAGDIVGVVTRGDCFKILGVVTVEVMVAEAIQRGTLGCLHLRIPEIAAEHLVRTLSGQCDFDFPGDFFCQQIEGDVVLAHHGLGHAAYRFRQATQHFAIGDQVFVVARVEARDDLVGILELVAFFSVAADIFETDGEGAQVRHMVGQQADDQAGIKTSGEQHAYGHIGSQAMTLHHLAEHMPRGIQPILLAQRDDGPSRSPAPSNGDERLRRWP